MDDEPQTAVSFGNNSVFGGKFKQLFVLRIGVWMEQNLKFDLAFLKSVLVPVVLPGLPLEPPWHS